MESTRRIHNAEKKDSISEKGVIISHEGVDTEIIVRDLATVKNPMIIINQYPLEKLNVLEFITLENIEKIDLHKPTDKVCEYYGSRGKYGLIIITMEKRKWRKLKRKYGRKHRLQLIAWLYPTHELRSVGALVPKRRNPIRFLFTKLVT